MKVVKSTSNLEVNIILQISEKEARALNEFAMFGNYKDTQAFISKHWSSSIDLKGLAQFFDTVRGELSPHLKRADEARKLFKEVN